MRHLFSDNMHTVMRVEQKPVSQMRSQQLAADNDPINSQMTKSSLSPHFFLFEKPFHLDIIQIRAKWWLQFQFNANFKSKDYSDA